jgi:UDPglucose 6-dehydrogenase
MRISVIGLGKLGCPIASLYASVGHIVTGIDISQGAVDAINSGIAPVNEPQLQNLIDAGRQNFSATTNWEIGLQQSDVSVVIVPTPSQDDGTFTNRYVVEALSNIGEQYRKGVTAQSHTIIVASTVMPGSMAGEIQLALESAAGTSVGSHLGLVYSPQFIALGTVIRNLQYPDMILIGQSDRHSGEIAEALLRTVVMSDAAFQHMSLVNAEIVKLSVNTFVTTKISFANMLSEICDKFDGANIDVVTQAVGADSRIGTKYLSGGMGYGGPCFPRDNIALAALGRSLGVDASIAVATDLINDRQVDRLVNRVLSLGTSVKSVHIWGLSYKPDTEVIDASQGIQVANTLHAKGYDVAVHDPQVSQKMLGESPLAWISDLNSDVSPDVIILATPWKEYLELAPTVTPRVAFIDPWGLASVSNAFSIQPGR